MTTKIFLKTNPITKPVTFSSLENGDFFRCDGFYLVKVETNYAYHFHIKGLIPLEGETKVFKIQEVNIELKEYV